MANLLTNWATNPSAETNLTGYALNGDASGLTRVTGGTRGTYRVRVTAGGTLTAGRGMVLAVPYVPSYTSYVASADVTSSAAGMVEIIIQTVKSGTVQQTVIAPAVTMAANVTQRLAVGLNGATGDPNAVNVFVRFVANATTAAPSGTFLYVDGVMVHEGPSAVDYKDGSSAGWEWTGTAHASASQAQVITVATPLADMKPCPRVELVTTNLYSARATLYRSIPGSGVETPVPGAVNIVATDVVVAMDYEAPFSTTGVALNYRWHMLDANGNVIGYSVPVTTTLAFTGTVVQQPLDSNRAVLVENASTRTPSRNRPFSGELVKPPAASRPVWVGSGRAALSRLSFMFRTLTEADYNGLSRVFGDYGEFMSAVVCIRTSDRGMNLPQPFYGVVTDPNPTGLDWHRGGWITQWEWQVDEAARPAPGIATPALSYDDLTAAYASYTAFTTDNSSYIGAARRYEFSELT